MTTKLLIDEKDVYPWYERDRPKRRLRRQDKVNIIEDFFGNEMSIKELCRKYELSHAAVCAVISLYFKKPLYTITIQSNV